MTTNNELVISDRVWKRVIQYVQLSMLAGIDVSDYLRSIKVVSTGDQVDLAPGQDEKIQKEVDDAFAKLPQQVFLTRTSDTIDRERDVHEAMNELEQLDRAEKKPMIDHMENAIITRDGRPELLVGLNDRIIIERSLDMNGEKRWFDTRLYEIRKIDHDTGALRLWDIEAHCWAMSNYVSVASNDRYRVKVSHRINKLKRRSRKDETQETKPKNEKRNKPSEGEKQRKIYDSRGIIHLRIAGQAYSLDSTRAKAGDKLSATVNSNGTVTVKDPALGWSEIWSEIDI